ncbi:hypothetical protein [Luteipulveratus mongoliensis]|uniref:Uncharacterized protein n=1 Tax=Luteipulveratus mongoliensis TaxID=571913 RepID=A0A0K1JG44_9MICO|nr:hypothetical protein [Luteipulveratus mongoliensis]AKU15674.1 hypothetical protein VV02_07110 [Luteipulveratus mongoliensis]
MDDSTAPRHRRPAYRPGDEMDVGGESPDPAQLSEIAHETAAVLVGAGRASTDPEVRRRLIHLVDELGFSTVAELWAGRPATSLPGALWRLYTLREWVQRDPVGASADYDAGVRHADVAHAVAGPAEPFGPTEIKDLGDAILRGVFEGDLAVALDRAAAFCLVISTGRAHRADDRDGHDELGAESATRSASALLTTATDLQRCAALWRDDKLD